LFWGVGGKKFEKKGRCLHLAALPTKTFDEGRGTRSSTRNAGEGGQGGTIKQSVVDGKKKKGGALSKEPKKKSNGEKGAGKSKN